jgi:ribonuclease HI
MMSVYFDGCAKSNPHGPAGAGFVIEFGGQEHEGTHYVGPKATNNEAEYAGALCALEFVVNNFETKYKDLKELVIMGDSNLVIQQVAKRWKINAENLKPLNAKCQDLIAKLKKNGVKIELKHIPRAQNSKADKLSNQAIDEYDML